MNVSPTSDKKIKMRILLYITVALYFSRLSESVFTEMKKDFIKSIINELDIKHFVIIKNRSFQINANTDLLPLIQDLHRKQIFTSFLDVQQMNDVLDKQHYISSVTETTRTDLNAPKTFQPLKSLILLENDKLIKIFNVNC